MDEETKQMLAKRFEALPKSIQDLILSDYYQETLMGLGQKHQLNIEQLGIIEREVTMVLMGLINSSNFEGELTRELRVDKEKGRAITQDVSDKVFAKVRELLKLMNTPAGQEPTVEEDGNILKTTNIEPPSPPKTIPPAPVAPPVILPNTNAQIFQSAGIEITPALSIDKRDAVVDKKDREEMLRKIENPPVRDRGPSLAGSPVSNGTGRPSAEIHQQKLGGSFSLPKKETVYEEKASVSKPAPGVDPYREMPQ